MATSRSLRPMAPDELPAVAQIHLAAFPEGALTRLGKDVVQRYYDWQLRGPHECVAAVCSVEGTLVGYVFAGVFRGAMSGFLRANMTFLALRVAIRPWLLLDRLIRDRVKSAGALLRRQIFKSAKRHSASSMDKGPRVRAAFGVLSLAVLPTYQGSGIGGALMDYVEDLAVHKGFQHMHLFVNPENRQALQFYEKLGWRRAHSRNGWQGRMEKTLPLSFHA